MNRDDDIPPRDDDAPSPWVRPTIIWTTALIFVPMVIYTALVFGGLPPLPMMLCILISHGGFCLIIARARPYKGPYRDDTYEDPGPGDPPRL